ncbi:MAG: HAMP domain-containing sensor histidine kinase [Chloroflexota bacterium]|nr:HAMP domain-containing sensor histidine kinase [Chloroflexota bacterium]
MAGIRTRLALTLIALVAVTVAAIGIGVYAFTDASLRDRLIADARHQADFNLSVLLPGADPRPADAAAFAISGLPEAFKLRGDVETIADYGDDDVFSSLALQGALDEVSPDLRSLVGQGQLGYAFQVLRGNDVLIVGGRSEGREPDCYFIFPARPVIDAVAQLRLGLLGAGLIAVSVALLAAGIIARGILRPVDAAGRAARRIAAGDLRARVPERGRDEFARWAAEFNKMADALETTVGSLEAAQQQNRRFVADVAHELRTPLTALVAEASLIEGGLEGLSPGARRAAELLVADVRRLRTLVDELMEISRFDAAAEQPQLERMDLGRVVTSVVAARLPEAAVSIPRDPVAVDSDPRRLDRIVSNLLDNARAHAPGAPVEVALTMTLGGALVVVADRGPGVPADALPRLFERFFKADPSRGSGGSGLGLAIAAEHAALLGGTLRARARPGGGLVFVLTLPVTRSLPPRDGDDMEPGDDVGPSESA